MGQTDNNKLWLIIENPYFCGVSFCSIIVVLQLQLAGKMDWTKIDITIEFNENLDS